MITVRKEIIDQTASQNDKQTRHDQIVRQIESQFVKPVYNMVNNYNKAMKRDNNDYQYLIFQLALQSCQFWSILQMHSLLKDKETISNFKKCDKALLNKNLYKYVDQNNLYFKNHFPKSNQKGLEINGDLDDLFDCVDFMKQKVDYDRMQSIIDKLNQNSIVLADLIEDQRKIG